MYRSNCPHLFNYDLVYRTFYPQPEFIEPVEIQHIKLYETMHEESIYFQCCCDHRSVLATKAEALRVLYAQLINTWSDYEKFLDEELPFRRFEKK